MNFILGNVMQNCSLLTLVVFLLGCAIGALLNSIYRASTLARVKEAFERELGAINRTADMALISQRHAGKQQVSTLGSKSSGAQCRLP